MKIMLNSIGVEEITENSHDIIGMIADTRKLIQKTLVSGNSLTTTQTRKYIYIHI